jgi:hypothetical protein
MPEAVSLALWPGNLPEHCRTARRDIADAVDGFGFASIAFARSRQPPLRKLEHQFRPVESDAVRQSKKHDVSAPNALREETTVRKADPHAFGTPRESAALPCKTRAQSRRPRRGGETHSAIAFTVALLLVAHHCCSAGRFRHFAIDPGNLFDPTAAF